MKQRGRKSKSKQPIKVVDLDDARPKAPAGLDDEASELWDSILCRFPRDHFNEADLQLLREFCHSSATLLPQANSQLDRFYGAGALNQRATLVKEIQSLSTKLRLCMSSRTRGDLASVRNAGKGSEKKPWEREG